MTSSLAVPSRKRPRRKSVSVAETAISNSVACWSRETKLTWAQAILLVWSKELSPSITKDSDSSLFLSQKKRIIEKALRMWIFRRRTGIKKLPPRPASPKTISPPILVMFDWIVPSLLSSEPGVCNAAVDLVSQLAFVVVPESFAELLLWGFKKNPTRHVVNTLVEITKKRRAMVSRSLWGEVSTQFVSKMNSLLLRVVMEGSVLSSNEQDLLTALVTGVVLVGREGPKPLLLLSTALLTCLSPASLVDPLELPLEQPCSLTEAAQVLNLLTTEQQVMASSLVKPVKFVLTAMLNAIKIMQQPAPPPSVSVHCFRAATQEEYFQHAMENPIMSLSLIREDGQNPTVSDLLTKIAQEVKVDSDLLELLVCKKILHKNLKLHDVYECMWKTCKEFDDVMPVTFRIMAIDGEACEDYVNELSTKETVETATTVPRVDISAAFPALVSLLKSVLQCHPDTELLTLVQFLLDICVSGNEQELLRCGILSPLLECMFRFHTAGTLSLLEALCLEDLVDDGQVYFDSVLNRLSQLEPSAGMAKVLSALANETRAYELVSRLMVLEGDWLEYVVEYGSRFVCSACVSLGIAQQGLVWMESLDLTAATPVDTLRWLHVWKGLVKEPSCALLLVQSSVALKNLIRMEEIPNATLPQVGDLAWSILDELKHVDSVRELQVIRKRELSQVAKKRQQAKTKVQKRKKQRVLFETVQEEEEDNKLLKCCVCYEGSGLLCVYVYCKRHSAMASSFVGIHPACHEAALKVDCEQGKSEWEGATIRNGHVLCNNLLPVRGPHTNLDMYADALHDFFERQEDSAKEWLVLIGQELQALITRIACQESVAADTNGGSIESNLSLIVPLVQAARYLKDEEKRIPVDQVPDWVLRVVNHPGWTSEEERLETFRRIELQTPIASCLYFAMIDFMMTKFSLEGQEDVFGMLTHSLDLAKLVRELVQLPGVPAFYRHLKIPM